MDHQGINRPLLMPRSSSSVLFFSFQGKVLNHVILVGVPSLKGPVFSFAAIYLTDFIHSFMDVLCV